MSFRPRNHRLPWSLGLLALLAVFLMVRWSVLDLDQHVRREGLSSQVYISARSVLIDHLDVETGMRGYLIGKRDEYLRPYHEGLGRLGADLDRLRAQVGDDPVESAHVDAMSRLSEGVLAEFVALFDASKEGGTTAARERFVAHSTKPAMDEIRSHLGAIQAEEQARVDRHARSLGRQMVNTLWLLDAASLLVGVILVSLASGIFAREAGP